MIEDGERGGLAVERAAAPRAHEDEIRVDADLAQHRDEQRRLVLAVAEAAREHLRDLVGLEAVDAELEAHVARARDDEVVDGAHARAVVVARRDDGARRAAQLVVGRELLLDEPPVPRADVVPARVRADVQVGRDLGEPGHGRLGVDGRDVARRERVDALVARLGRPCARGPARAACCCRWGGSRARCSVYSQRRLGTLSAIVSQVAEVVGHLVLGRDVLDDVLDLEDVARAQALEAHDLGAVVVVEAVPRLGEIDVVALGRLEDLERAARRRAR